MLSAAPSFAARRLGADGFTLIELLVVMAIIAVLMLAMPTVTAGIANVRLDAAADDVSEQLHKLREAAISSGGVTELRIDVAARSYTTSLLAKPVMLPKVVDRVEFVSTAALRLGKVSRLVFFPDGSSTGGNVRLAHGNRSATIVIDWLGGRIERHD